MKAGDIYWVNLDPTIGHEIQRRRPVIVLNPGHQKHLKLCIVIPITSWNAKWDNNPFFIVLEPNDINKLKKKSVADCFQIRAVSHKRLREKIGSISKGEIAAIKQSISLILDIDPEHCE